MTKLSAPSIQIDGKTLPLAELSDVARAQVQNLAVVDAEIKRLQTRIGIATAAQQQFLAVLRAELNQTPG